ncbi:uracil-DNA glycosylase [Erysipelotrichaceae bacterium OH741_COT-311]|nr:uracil-DNA glycosylase [Erysipelotrichaceae bacterium OH741_COT-311]
MYKNDWDTFLKTEFEQVYFKQLASFLKKEYQEKTVYPPKKEVFRIFQLCPYHKVKVVILGQDPYHQPNQACGMSFAVNKGVKLPPSLVNIYKEIRNDLGISTFHHGYLYDWATQGVFLLNAILTVEANKAASHRNKGWEIFTDHVIEHLNNRSDPIVFMLWGNFAKEKAKLISNPQHLVLTSAHPSPLSAHQGFFNNHHFSRCNTFLNKHYNKSIHWEVL